MEQRRCPTSSNPDPHPNPDPGPNPNPNLTTDPDPSPSPNPEQVLPNLVHYNAMMRACAAAGQHEAAVQLLSEMACRRSCNQPNPTLALTPTLILALALALAQTLTLIST